jgi:hypothetical protein
MVVAVDDEIPISLMRLFNEPAGKKYLAAKGVSPALLDMLDLLGISCIGNLVTAIKFARYYELGEQDIVMTVLTDSMEMYASRLIELNQERGEFTDSDAAAVYARNIEGLTIDNMEELTYYGRKRIHNPGLSNRAKPMKRFSSNGMTMITGKASLPIWIKSMP